MSLRAHVVPATALAVFALASFAAAATITKLGPVPVLPSAPATLQLTERATSFLPTLGFEDDVDLVVAPDGEFMVLCEENQDGTAAQVSTINLDPTTGQPLGIGYTELALGFENAVDPIIVPQAVAAVDGYAVLIPEETENGGISGLLVLRVNASGALLERHAYDLRDLGFRPDVDGITSAYPDRLIATFPLESENNDVRGVIAVDIDVAGASFGTATLLSSDGRAAATVNHLVNFLPGLSDAMDPLLFNSGSSARMALPVTGVGGSDLLLIDFDPGCGVGCEPPQWLGYTSVKDVNSTGLHPLAFPGYERDVDLRLFSSGECGLAATGYHIMIPVEGPGDVADLYMVDQDGIYEWAYSKVSTGAPIRGYEAGVDLLPLCGLPIVPANRLAVPVENSAGTLADLYIINTPTGALIRHVNDPTLNPGNPIVGYEVGVEPLLWLDGGLMVVAVENAATSALLSVAPNATVVSSLVNGLVLGFIRSVDPIVAAVPDPDRTLFVPVGKDDGSDRNVLMFNAPPNLAAVASLEVINPPMVMKPFEWDVDVGLMNKVDPGGAYVYLPEENAAGTSARLRFELVPTSFAGRVLAVATNPPNPAASGSLYFFRTTNGTLIIEHSDVLGLETGLDMANGRGSVIPANPPGPRVPPGYDADTDPTLYWLTDVVSVPRGVEKADLSIEHANPVRFPVSIRYRLPEAGSVRLAVVDVAGRTVRLLFDGRWEAGVRVSEWDGLDERGIPVGSGMYFLTLRTAAGAVASKAVVVR